MATVIDQTYWIKLPPAFITDCIECDVDVGEYSKREGALTATAEQLAELRSRADHYATGGLDMAPIGIIRSAQATIKRLDEAAQYHGERARINGNEAVYNREAADAFLGR